MCGLFKLNAHTKKDPFPTSFWKFILYIIMGHEMYSLMENYNGYNQVKMVQEDKVKPTFILEWGAYAYNVLSFGLCNVLATFQEVFKWLYASVSWQF